MQYIYNSLLIVATQKAVVLIKGIKEAWLSNQIKDIKDKLRAVFKACNKTAKNKNNKIYKIKLLKLLIKFFIKIGLFAVPTL